MFHNREETVSAMIPQGQDSDDQFEFECVTTPESPTSPADHFFCNGKLLPHAFPNQTPNTLWYSRSSSQTSSISSKDSWMSSRSNSSARTSMSEASETKLPSRDGSLLPVRKERRKPVFSCQYQYGSSRRWQLFAAAPVLSRSRKDQTLESKKSRGTESKSWFGRKILKSFMSACIEFHAIQT